MINVIRKIERPDKGILAKYKKVAPATAYEAQGKVGAMMSYIKPTYSGMKVCGPAITVQCHPGDNIMLHKAITIAQSGDVLVVDVGGYTEAGYWGEVLTVAAQAKGIEGLVIDGSVRDALAIKKLGFPIFSRGLCMKGTVKETIGFNNHPLVCGNILVYPGDIVLGDDDGVVVIPKEKGMETLEKIQHREEKEKKIMQELAKGGSTLEIFEFDKVLENKGLQEE